MDQPFLAYKESASINRALLKCKLKEKPLTKAEKKVIDVVTQEREDAKMRKKRILEIERMKRLNENISDVSISKIVQNRLTLPEEEGTT